MRIALEEAQKAFDAGDVPIGAVLVKNDQILAKDHNRREALKDISAHAEILVMKKASQLLDNWRLNGTTLYVTLEPCPMCASAIMDARIRRLVYGARNTVQGAILSRFNFPEDLADINKILVTEGVLESQCSQILKSFFEMWR